MASIGVLRAVLVLRIITLLALAASVVVMALNYLKDDEVSKFMTKLLRSYRFVLACGVIGSAYSLIQIPFAIYNVAQEKRWIRNGCLQPFDFYGDKVMAFLLASGVGVGFGVTLEFKRDFGDQLDDPKAKKFLDMGNISTGLLVAGFVFMAILSILSSIRHSSTTKRFFK